MPRRLGPTAIFATNLLAVVVLIGAVQAFDAHYHANRFGGGLGTMEETMMAALCSIAGPPALLVLGWLLLTLRGSGQVSFVNASLPVIGAVALTSELPGLFVYLPGPGRSVECLLFPRAGWLFRWAFFPP